MKPAIRGRRTMVTDEPMRIAPDLMGHSLASVRRRFAALALDSLVFGLFTFCFFIGITLLSFHFEDPDLLRDVRTLSSADAPEELRDDVLERFLTIAIKRQPEVLSPELQALLLAGDFEVFTEQFGKIETTITYRANGETRIVAGQEGRRLELGNDVLLGRYDNVFGWGAFFVGWFTLWTWIGHGRTLGKRAFGLKVVRLDGKPLRLWDSFGRAGGYAASAATLMLGFLEASWHPNRQAMHDKVSGTVVLRIRRGDSR